MRVSLMLNDIPYIKFFIKQRVTFKLCILFLLSFVGEYFQQHILSGQVDFVCCLYTFDIPTIIQIIKTLSHINIEISVIKGFNK